jgi:hypothetical protein
MPSAATAVYEMGDSMRVELDAGGQLLEMRVDLSATFGATFTRAAEGIEVSMDVSEFGAHLRQPMGGPVRVDGSGIEGPLVFSLDRRGAVTLISEPTLSSEAKQFFPALSTAHTFFPRLPGTPVAAGDTWTDTISYSGAEGEGSVTAVNAMTYTVVGDTMVDGRNLMKVTFVGEQEATGSGVTQGMDFRQELSGSVQGHVLWDMPAGAMVEHFTESDGRGSMEVSAAPFPLGVRSVRTQMIRLVDGM